MIHQAVRYRYSKMSVVTTTKSSLQLRTKILLILVSFIVNINNARLIILINIHQVIILGSADDPRDECQFILWIHLVQSFIMSMSSTIV